VCQSGRPTPASGKGVPPAHLITGVDHEVGEMDPGLAEALNAFGAGRYDECRTRAQALISASSDPSTRADCVGLIILSHLHQGHFAAAREAAERLRSVSPDVCQDLLAQVNRDERDYNAEVSRLQHIVATTKDPEEAARAQLRIARVHHVFGRLEQAGQSCQEVIKRNPSHPEAVCAVSQLALMAMERREYAKGLSLMEEVVGRHPNTPAALRAQTAIPRIYLAQGKPERAVEACSAIARRYRGTEVAAEAQMAIPRIHLVQGKPERAVEAYSAIARRYPETEVAAEAQMAIPMIHLAQGKPERALEAYSAIIRGHPGTEAAAEAQFAMARIHRQQGKIEEAEAAYLTAARNYRGTAPSRQARDALAKMYYSRGKAAMAAGWNPAAVKASLEAYRNGVHADPDTDRKSKYTLHVAELYGGLQRWQEARAAAREVLKLDPPDNLEFAKRRRAARFAIVSYYQQEGRLQEALAGFQNLLAESTDPEERESLASAIADIESQLNPNPLYVETRGAEPKEAQ
jgi:tetratricopeptide (TPR) repeat protein